MKARSTYAFVTLLSLAASAPLLAQDDRAALGATVTALRDAGTALTAWVVERTGGDRTFLDRVVTTSSFDWSACPSITAAAARDLVGPGPAAKLRERDGWGHALEYCLQTDKPGSSTHVVGVR